MSLSAKRASSVVAGTLAAVALAAGCTSFGTTSDPPVTNGSDGAITTPGADVAPPALDASSADTSDPVVDAAPSECDLVERIDFSAATSFDSPAWGKTSTAQERVRIQRESTAGADLLHGDTTQRTMLDDFAVGTHHVAYVANRTTRISFEIGAIEADAALEMVLAQIPGLVGRDNLMVVWKQKALHFLVTNDASPFLSVTVDPTLMSRVRIDIDRDGSKISAAVNDGIVTSRGGKISITNAPPGVNLGPGAGLQLGLFFPFATQAKDSPTTHARYDNVKVEQCK